MQGSPRCNPRPIHTQRHARDRQVEQKAAILHPGKVIIESFLNKVPNKKLVRVVESYGYKIE